MNFPYLSSPPDAATETASRMLADALHLFSGDLRRVPICLVPVGKPVENPWKHQDHPKSSDIQWYSKEVELHVPIFCHISPMSWQNLQFCNHDIPSEIRGCSWWSFLPWPGSGQSVSSPIPGALFKMRSNHGRFILIIVGDIDEYYSHLFTILITIPLLRNDWM